MELTISSLATQRDVAFEIQALRCTAGIHDERMRPLNYWEIIADNLRKAGWSWGCVATVHRQGRTIWIADAHRDDGQRFVVHADCFATFPRARVRVNVATRLRSG
jgi:hypothetical protein